MDESFLNSYVSGGVFLCFLGVFVFSGFSGVFLGFSVFFLGFSGVFLGFSGVFLGFSGVFLGLSGVFLGFSMGTPQRPSLFLDQSWFCELLVILSYTFVHES